MTISISLFIIIGLIFYLTYTKIEFIKIRTDSKKISAEVIEYRREKGPMRNDYTKLDYPYVKILDNNEYTIKKLKYATSGNRPFEIGQKIDVFWYGNDLLYWNAYDNGINKYLPNKWNFIN